MFCYWGRVSGKVDRERKDEKEGEDVKWEIR